MCLFCLRSVTGPQDTFTVYELPQLDVEIPSEWQYSPVHGREPVACPLCGQSLRAMHVGGFARTRVALLAEFQQTRKRICPECERVLFTELSGLLRNADPFCPAGVRH